jgi:hypothetical protein
MVSSLVGSCSMVDTCLIYARMALPDGVCGDVDPARWLRRRSPASEYCCEPDTTLPADDTWITAVADLVPHA